MADSEKQLSDQHQQPLDSQGESDQSQSKSLPPKEIIATKVTGTVKWFNVKSGYGFINRNDTKEDVFVHQSAIVKNNPKKAVRSVGDGEVVEFDVVIGEKGNEAANVTGPSGEPVRGSQFAADKRKNYRPYGRRNRNRKQDLVKSRSQDGLNQIRDQDNDSGDDNRSTDNGQQPQRQQRQQRTYRRNNGNYRGPRGGGRGGRGFGGGPNNGGFGGGNIGGGHQISEGQGQPNRRGGPQRRYFRRNFNNGRRGGGGGSRNGEGGPNGPAPRRNRSQQQQQRRPKKGSMSGGQPGGDQQQDGGHEVQNTTTESTA